MKKNVLALIEARMGSSRLKGKVLKKLGKTTVLDLLVKRVKKAHNIDKVVVITSKNKKDNLLVNHLKKKKIKYFRGSEQNVLNRILISSRLFKGDIIVRLTADNPLIDPTMINHMVQYIKKNNKINYLCNGYISSFKKRQLPYGLDIELFRFKAMEKFKHLAITKKFKEHPTMIFLKNRKKCDAQSFKIKKNYKFNPKIRLTIDTRKDYKMVSNLYLILYKKFKNRFNTKNILSVLKKNKWLISINEKVEQKNL